MNINPNYRPGWKARTIVAAYLALMLLTFLVEATDVDASTTPPTATAQSADQPDAVCYPHAWYHKFGTVFWTKLFPGTGYEVTIDYEFRYSHCQVRMVWRDCEVNWALGWNISGMTCRHWLNTAGTRLAVQVNYTACLVAKGGPICSAGWAKRVLGVDGQTISTEGSFLN